MQGDDEPADLEGDRRSLLHQQRPTIQPDATEEWEIRQKLYQNERKQPPVVSPVEPGTAAVSNIKLLLVVAMVVGFLVAYFASFWVMWVYMNYPECGTDLPSARFSVNTSSTYNRTQNTDDDDAFSSWSRLLSGNACPGYDWTGQTTPGVAGEIDFEFALPLIPVNCTQPTEVGLDDPYFGQIGYALNGVALFSPSDGDFLDAIETEHETFDACGGHVKSQGLLINKFLQQTDCPGDYHYHAMPGDGLAYEHSADLNLNFSLCDDVSSWYTETPGEHSPLVGFMLDGIPIYGPQGAGGAIPTDFDECGGHASDLTFHHYHFKSQYPYSVDCLWGRSGHGDGFMDNYNECEVSATQSNYSSLVDFSVSYGGTGVNKRNTLGCFLLLGFGCALLFYAALHLLYISLQETCVRR